MSAGRLIAAPKAAARAVVAIALTTTALVGGTTTAATAATVGPSYVGTGTYIGTGTIENEWSHRCLDEDRNAGPVDRAIVQIYQCNGWTNQQWKFYLQPGGDGHTYYLINVYSGLCLDADTNTINRNGTRIQVYGCNGWSNQNWHFPLVSGVPVFVWNMYNLFSGSPPKDMLDQDNTTGGGDRSKVQLWQFTEGLNQQWRVFLN